MMRLMGAALVVAGCGALGLRAAARLEGRVRDLGELAAGLDTLRRELGWRLSPLPDGLDAAGRALHGPAAEFFAQCARRARAPDGQAFQEVWRSELDAALLRLKPEDRVLLERLGPVLGRYDGDSQRLALEEGAAGLRALQGAAADERNRLGRVYGVLGVTAGLFLAILLI